MKKLFSTLLMTALLCAGASANAETYTSVQQGFGGEVSVSVTIEGDKMTDVTVVGEKETIGVGSIAIEKLPGAMVDAQSVLVDGVTSATVTSTAILAGAKDCVEQAGMADTFCVAVEKTAASTEVKRYEADVVVVGGGMSGMSAALSAANSGASVFLMEKLPMTGGNAKSAAGNYMVAELPENGFQVSDVPDTLDAALARWKEKEDTGSYRESIYPDYDRLSAMLVETGNTLRSWQEQFGITYKVANPIEDTGMLILQSDIDGDPNATMAGRLIAHFAETATEKGATIVTNTAAHDLIMDGGKVVGVKATDEDGEIEVYGKNVILACGGFLANPEMVAEILPEIYSVTSISCVGNTGDGIGMALSAGAQLLEYPWINPCWIAPRQDFVNINPLANVFQENNSPIDESESSYYRLGVNSKGERYQNEAGQYATQLLTLTYGGEHPYYALYDNLDERVAEIAESGLDCGAVIKGETLEELAQNAGFDKDTFLATVARYNEMCEKGVDDDFGKDAEHLKAVGENGPYYLVEMCPAGSDTLSGVKTDANFRALNADGQPIEGLYAVGSMSLGIFYNQYYFSGSALTFSATSGRIAGADAAQAE